MITQTQHTEWERSLKEFCKRNWSRKSRLVLLDSEGRREQERGLPLNGISIGLDADGSSRVEIMLGGHSARDPRHLVHTIRRVRIVRSSLAMNCCDTLEVEDLDGTTTILDFGPLTQLGGT